MAASTHRAPNTTDKAPYVKAIADYIEERKLKGWDTIQRLADNPTFDNASLASWKQVIKKHPRQLKYQQVTINTILDILWTSYDSVEEMHLRLQQTIDVLPLKKDAETLSRFKEKIQKVLSDNDIKALVNKMVTIQEENLTLQTDKETLTQEKTALEESVATIQSQLDDKDKQHQLLKNQCKELKENIENLKKENKEKTEKIINLESTICDFREQLLNANQKIEQQEQTIKTVQKNGDEKANQIKKDCDEKINNLFEKNNLFMQKMLSEFETVKTKNTELNDENSQLRKQVTQQQTTPPLKNDHTQKDVDKPPVTTAFSTVFHSPTNHNEASMLSKDAKKSVSMTHSG